MRVRVRDGGGGVRLLGVGTFAIALAALVSAQQVPATKPSAYPFAGPDVQQFVRAALTDRLRANDVPDLNLLQSSRRIGVRDVMPKAHLLLQESALPELDPYQLFLLSPADAQAMADRRAATIPFITIDQPSIDGDRATISLGVDIATPSNPRVIKLCCCTGQAEFHRSGGGWTFVKWLTTVCS